MPPADSLSIPPPGGYIIHSVAFSSQVLAAPPGPQPPTSPAGWNQAQLPPQLKQWQVGVFQRGASIFNPATGKYLSAVGPKIVLDSKPYVWVFVSAPQEAGVRIRDPSQGNAFLQLTGPANGAPLTLNPESSDARQIWGFQSN